MQGLDRLAFSPAQVREFDRIAIEVGGIPGYTLMSRAGEAVLRAARESFPAARRWLVLCGAGNNAGDGYVVARLAQAAGIECRVAALSDPEKLSGDAARAWQALRDAGGEVVRFDAADLDGCDLVIDALLGTGLDRPLAGRWLECVQVVAAAGRPAVAVDIPTGLHAGTGEVLGAAVPAALTVTFVGLKQGLFLGAGPDYRGELRFDPLGIPPELLPVTRPAFALYGPEELAGFLPARPATAHKGLFGHVLVIGGNVGMGGAARLAGEAALRAGAGLVSVAAHPENAAALLASRPELMSRGVTAAAALAPLLTRATVIALGPGLGRDAWAEALFDAALAAPQPKLLDADALNWLAERPARRDDWILTPHPGEAARLLGCTAAEVQHDRLAALAALVERYGGVVLLKGRGTLVARSNVTPWLIDRGNPGMATAGMGDVLTGLIAGLLAQRDEQPLEAAAAGAWAHAIAGDRAARAGQRGLLASDLLAELRACLNP